jgi:hypothetical protein
MISTHTPEHLSDLVTDQGGGSRLADRNRGPKNFALAALK